eukprot:3169901-Pyramimonas_sp.AAC.1
MRDGVASDGHTTKTALQGPLSEPFGGAPGITNSFENTNTYKIGESFIQISQLGNKSIGLIIGRLRGPISEPRGQPTGIKVTKVNRPQGALRFVLKTFARLLGHSRMHAFRQLGRQGTSVLSLLSSAAASASRPRWNAEEKNAVRYLAASLTSPKLRTSVLNDRSLKSLKMPDGKENSEQR